MKRFATRTLITTLLLFTWGTTAFSQDHPSPTIDMNGLIVSAGERLSDVTVTIYEHNQKVKTLQTNWLGKIDLELRKNSYYTAEVTIPGYYTKRVAIDTDMPYDASPPVFKFQVDLIEKTDQMKELLSRKEKALFDYPSAIVDYDQRSGKMDFNLEYTYSYHTDAQELLIRSEYRKLMKSEKKGQLASME